MRNLVFIFAVMGTYLGLAWATQERPTLDTNTKKSMRMILQKINETEEVHKINQDELYSADKAGQIEGEDQVSANQAPDGLNTTSN